MTNDNDTPAIIKVPTEPPTIASDANLEAVINSDLKHANTMLNALYSAWPSVSTIAQLTRMVDTTMSTIERRRKLLNLQYGHTNNAAKTVSIDPLD